LGLRIYAQMEDCWCIRMELTKRTATALYKGIHQLTETTRFRRGLTLLLLWQRGF